MTLLFPSETAMSVAHSSLAERVEQKEIGELVPANQSTNETR